LLHHWNLVVSQQRHILVKQSKNTSIIGQDGLAHVVPPDCDTLAFGIKAGIRFGPVLRKRCAILKP